MTKWQEITKDSPPLEERVLCTTLCDTCSVGIFIKIPISLSKNSTGWAWYREGDCFCSSDLEQYGYDYCNEPLKWAYIPQDD